MISLDQGLLGLKNSGDVVARHARYGEAVTRLDIIVFSPVEKAVRISDHVDAFSTRSADTLRNIISAYRIGSRLFRRSPYDLIVTQDPMFTGLVGWLLKLRFHSKLLVHLHGDFLGSNSWYRRRLSQRVRLALAWGVVKGANAIRVMSNEQKKSLERAGIGSDRIRVISTPVELGKFLDGARGNEVVLNLDGRSWSQTVLMVGRKDPVKDFDTLFKAISIVFESQAEVGLWLVGNYDNASEVPLPEDRVVLTPSVPSEMMPECYRRADIVVLSSRSESFGKVLVEANASGKPVVATSTAGGREIVEHGSNGYLVPVGNYRELASRILELLNDPRLATQFGENGRTMVKARYENNSKKVVNYWHDIISGGL